MNRYFIEEVKCGVGEGGMACGPICGPVVAEAKIKTDAGEEFFMSLAEVDGMPNFFKTPESTYDLQMDLDADEEEFEKFQNYFMETGDYDEIFEEKDPEWFQLYRYLIYIVRSDWDECEEFQKATTGKYLDEIVIPKSDLEEEYDEDMEFDVEIPDNKDDLYKMRLSLETDIEEESVFHDMDVESFEAEKYQLVACVEACEDEKDYQEWKKMFIDSEYEKMADRKFLVCKYIFAGIGQYEMIIPAEEIENFQCWIRGNGSAFDGGSREADEEEIKKYIALNAAR